MKNICPSCGNTLTATSKFCGNCGTKLAELPEKPIDNKPNPEDTTNENEEEQIPDHIIFINPETGERILPRWQEFLKNLSPEKRESLNKEILESYEQHQLRDKYFGAKGRKIN
jgi:hypothetical protein